MHQMRTARLQVTVIFLCSYDHVFDVLHSVDHLFFNECYFFVICSRRIAFRFEKPQGASRATNPTVTSLLSLTGSLCAGRWDYSGHLQRSAYWVELCVQEKGLATLAGGRSGRGGCCVPQVGKSLRRNWVSSENNDQAVYAL